MIFYKDPHSLPGDQPLLEGSFLSSVGDSHNGLPTLTNNHSPKELAEQMMLVLKKFMKAVEYSPPESAAVFSNTELEAAIVKDMSKYRIERSAAMDKFVQIATTFTESNYPHVTFDEKLVVALCICYAFYIDDAAPQNLEAFEAFEFRLLHNLPQLDPALDAFAAVLKRMWDFYDALSARAIFTACLEFVDMTCIEPSMSQVEMHRTSQRLPWYIRQRSSGSTPFAVFTFPRRLGIPFMAYFPVLPDMDYFLSGINDLFSFYKEELKGEEGNFVHMRARAEGKPPMQVAAELSEELLVARSTIHAALRPHPEAFKAWIDREKGYIAWHMFLPRYKLQEIGLPFSTAK